MWSVEPQVAADACRGIEKQGGHGFTEEEKKQTRKPLQRKGINLLA